MYYNPLCINHMFFVADIAVAVLSLVVAVALVVALVVAVVVAVVVVE